jgi:hypothetical protein
MESGAALRANAISAFRSGIRYSLTAAMLAYEVLVCACICEFAASAMASTELANPNILQVLRAIHFPFQRGSWDDPSSVIGPIHLRTVFTYHLRLASKFQTLFIKV